MWVVADTTIVGATSPDPKPQFSFVGRAIKSLQDCQGALLERQNGDIRLVRNNQGKFLLLSQARNNI